VVDKENGEPLTGAIVEVEGTPLKTVTDAEGKFSLEIKDTKANTLLIKYVGYKPQRIDGVQKKLSGGNDLKVALEADEQQLSGVTVTGVERKNTQSAAVLAIKNSSVIVSNISAQEIALTQDTNAGEVIRRVPGVSLIDEKFVMVRGLSQRYNNVWINNGAVPSSEADSRAFSFDIIPSSQIDNLQIIKTMSPEYPADYCGGFILINTKEIPVENSFNVMVGGNWNTNSAFNDFSYTKGSGTDFLGFDSGKRGLDGGIHTSLAGYDIDRSVSLTGNGFNNDWRVKSKTPLGDLKLALNYNHHWNLKGNSLGMIAAANYTSEYRTYTNMENNLFGVYDVLQDKKNYLRHSIDDQFNHNVRVGGMLNFTFLTANGLNKFQFKNIFNQLGNDRYTWREGYNAQSDTQWSAESYYRSRTTYNTQLTGKHTLKHDELDWNLGFALATRKIPDRKRYLVSNELDNDVMQLCYSNDISREWTDLDEQIYSISVNDKHDFKFGNWQPSIKFGGYYEYRTREYNTRYFIYNWDPSNNTLPSDFRTMDMTELLSNEQYFGQDKLYMLDDTDLRNDYIGHNTMAAGYALASLPFGKLSFYGGLRFEHNMMSLISNTKIYEKSHSARHYTDNDLFPSANLNYKIDDKNQVRLSYGRSVNRPEFREVSPSVFYDFDLASDVQGNTELKSCYIDNVDLRYEWYPHRGEIISLAAFYKHFENPIEWTYTVTGGTDLVYSYQNAKSANNYGLELDIKKTLDFIGLPQFSFSFNGSLIDSKVKFEKGSNYKDRPMQGQSKYLVNAGLFYKNEKLKLDVALLYNRIGKRIIGVGRNEGTSSGTDVNTRVPDSYEMPRNSLDLTATKKFGNHFEFKLYARDLLNEKVQYKQFADVEYSDGSTANITELSRNYRPGVNLGLQAIYKF
jgi:TonB-dependent receptor